MPEKKSHKVKTIIGLLVSVAFLVWIGYSFDLKEIKHSVQSANFLYLIPISIIFVFNFVIRAVRWKSLFPESTPVKFKHAFRCLMIGYLFNNLLPARAGEFIKIHMLGRVAQLSRSTVLGSVLIEKVADLLIMLAILSLILVFYPVPIWTRQAGLFVGLIGFSALMGLVVIRLVGEKLTTSILTRLKFLSDKLIKRIESVSSSFLQGISGLFHSAHFFRFIFYSVCIWTLEVAVVYLVAQGFHLPVGFWDSLLILVVISIGTMVPSSPGYVGTYEFFGVAALALLNITGAEALAFVVSLHALMLISSSTIGWVCLITRPVKEKLAYQDDIDETDTLTSIPEAYESEPISKKISHEKT